MVLGTGSSSRTGDCLWSLTYLVCSLNFTSFLIFQISSIIQLTHYFLINILFQNLSSRHRQPNGRPYHARAATRLRQRIGGTGGKGTRRNHQGLWCCDLRRLSPRTCEPGGGGAATIYCRTKRDGAELDFRIHRPGAQFKWIQVPEPSVFPEKPRSPRESWIVMRIHISSKYSFTKF